MEYNMKKTVVMMMVMELGVLRHEEAISETHDCWASSLSCSGRCLLVLCNPCFVGDLPACSPGNCFGCVLLATVLEYMSPETLRCPTKKTPDQFKNTPGAQHYEMGADAWAVGTFAYELVVGSPPFKAPGGEVCVCACVYVLWVSAVRSPRRRGVCMYGLA
eukprot:scaffold188774_cov23-Tisochrysis_lutea.AAC.1